VPSINSRMEINDICYTPLDIPDRPDIDIQKFLAWAKAVYPQSVKDVATSSEDKFPDDYPWDLVFGCYDGYWKNDFEKEFPELAEYSYAAFGMRRYELATVVFLPIRQHVSGISFWHSDSDITGFRYYLECENHIDNPLLVRKTVEPYDELNGIVVPFNGDDDRLQKEVYTCDMTSPHQAFYVNNCRAVHAPTVYVPGIRIAGFVVPKTMYEKIVRNRSKKMIVNSALKFKDHAILW